MILIFGASSQLPDIRRVFSYHGAEHKTINAYEAGDRLESRTGGETFVGTSPLRDILPAHPGVDLDCSVQPAWPGASQGLRLLSRILMLPVLAGIAYEYIRWTANHLSSPFVRWMIKPNLALNI